MVNNFFCFSIHPPRPLLYRSLVLHTILEICRVHGASSLLPPGHRYPLMSRKAPVLMESHPRRPGPDQCRVTLNTCHVHSIEYLQLLLEGRHSPLL